MLDYQIVNHCAPTLAGIKTGNLFSIHGEKLGEVKQEVRRLNRILHGKGVILLPLKITDTYALIYVYRPDMLARDLLCPLASRILKNHGYTCSCPSSCLSKLIQRLRSSTEFPHEIGLFLGYPPEDVQGFISDPHGQSHSVHCCGGCWKVYHDPQKAQVLFQQYEKCTKLYCKRLKSGASLETLVVAG